MRDFDIILQIISRHDKHTSTRDELLALIYLQRLAHYLFHSHSNHMVHKIFHSNASSNRKIYDVIIHMTQLIESDNNLKIAHNEYLEVNLTYR